MTPERVGPYDVLDKLGSGGMGSVYLGRHVETGQMAAVKVLPASLARQEGFVERFNREIESMRRLTNPHIVALYDNGTDGDMYYYSMEYVAGETMMSLLRREKRVPWQRAVEMTLEICQALKAAHDAGIIHRDLKPSNLMITPEGTIKLADFGVAQVFASNRLTITGGIIGTAEFMSPEQAEGRRASKQSDLYSLGAVMYVLVTGRPPFAGSTAVEVIQKHKFGLFDRPRLIVPDLPVWLEEIICQLLEKDPAKRFPDALVLTRRLEQLSRKEERVISTDATLIETPDSADCDDATIPVEFQRQSGPGAATLMSRLLRAEVEQTTDDSWLSGLLNSTIVHLILLALVIGGGVWWFRNPDTVPAEEVDASLHLQEPQRIRKIARHYQQIGDPGLAESRLRSLQTLLEGNPEMSRQHELTTRMLDKLHAEQNSPEVRFQFLATALKRAADHQAADRLDDARRIWQAVIDLYASDPEAEEYVREAHQKLSEMP